MPLRSNFPTRPSRSDPEDAKREGWREYGIAVINVNNPKLTWEERELVRNLGNRFYGWGQHSRPKIGRA